MDAVCGTTAVQLVHEHRDVYAAVRFGRQVEFVRPKLRKRREEIGEEVARVLSPLHRRHVHRRVLCVYARMTRSARAYARACEPAGCVACAAVMSSFTHFCVAGMSQ
jgi:hypothetical protein